jgi:hypothetical protein
VSYHPPAVLDGTVWFGSIRLAEYADERPIGAVLCRADDDDDGITVVADLAAVPRGRRRSGLRGRGERHRRVDWLGRRFNRFVAISCPQ